MGPANYLLSPFHTGIGGFSKARALVRANRTALRNGLRRQGAVGDIPIRSPEGLVLDWFRELALPEVM